jgi:hypothetical protein
MRANQWIASVSIIAIGLLSASEALLAQEITGKPGAPGTTTTIDGRYMPPQTPPFSGHIQPNAAQSTHAWPMLVTPPKGAPNILLIMNGP